jgi:hypothetical protein
MKDKYLLHIINKIVSMVGSSRDLIYTYKYKEIVILIWTIILDEEIWRFTMFFILVL